MGTGIAEKSPSAKRGWRHQSGSAEGAGDLAAGFPVEKEEGLVLAVVKFWQKDRSADVGSELIAVEARRLRAGDARLEAV